MQGDPTLGARAVEEVTVAVGCQLPAVERIVRPATSHRERALVELGPHLARDEPLGVGYERVECVLEGREPEAVVDDRDRKSTV